MKPLQGNVKERRGTGFGMRDTGFGMRDAGCGPSTMLRPFDSSG